MNYDGSTTALVAGKPAIHHLTVTRQLRQRASAFVHLMDVYHRWILMLAPAYALVVGGPAAWRFAVLITAVVLVYNGVISAAEEHWATWARSRAIYLRCAEIALFCLALAWLPVEGLGSHFYLASVYALLVYLAAIGIGRESVIWTASTAALAVATYLAIVAYDDPLILAVAGDAYWPAVVLYSVSFWLIYIAVGLVPFVPWSMEVQQPLVGSKARSTSDLAREVTTHRERLATMGELTAQVLHGLSNPLTGITTIVDDLLADCDDTNRESLEQVKGEAERASALVRELLCFTRRDTVDPVVSVNEITDRAMNLFSLRARSDDIRIVYDLTSDSSAVEAGESRLEQVILNLLDNARHAIDGAADGTITVRTTTDNTHVMLEVSDNGVGMPPEVQKRIFEAFFTTKAPGVGTGLGLAIAAGIVRDHGGEIAVQSTPGSGSTFTISLPKAS
jgi:signal transduction histidine kinase